MLFLIHAIVHPDLFLLHLVIEVTLPAVIVGHTCIYHERAKQWKDDAYPHYFTGAFMTPGYPARGDGRAEELRMYFGGQPSYTYTTITLHSPPGLLTKAGLYIMNGPYYDSTGFRIDVYSPISIFTADSECIWLYNWGRDQWPAFLVSFQGIWYKTEAYRQNSMFTSCNQCGSSQLWRLGVMLFH